MKYQNVVILLSIASFATAVSKDGITGGSQDVGSNSTQRTILSAISISVEGNIDGKHPPSSSCDETTPPSSLCDESSPPTSSCKETTPPTSSCDETTPPSSSCEETTPPTSSCEKTTPPSSSFEETIPEPPITSETSPISLHPSQETETPTMKPTVEPTESPKTTIKAAHQKATETDFVTNEHTILVTFAPSHTSSYAIARTLTVEAFEAAAPHRDSVSAAILSTIFAVLLSIF